jgi:acyl dehydratase
MAAEKDDRIPGAGAGDGSARGAQRGDLDAVLAAFAGTADGAPGWCPYPVNEPMIHHWCDAIGDRNPAYLDRDFAEKSIHGGIIAPPAMLQAWTMRGLRPDTPKEAAAKRAAGDRKSVLQVLDENGYTSVVATNCEQEYLRSLRPGDRLTHTVEVESVSPEKKTGLGIGRFVTQLYKFFDAQGELVGTMRFRILKFKPPSREAGA